MTKYRSLESMRVQVISWKRIGLALAGIGAVLIGLLIVYVLGMFAYDEVQAHKAATQISHLFDDDPGMRLKPSPLLDKELEPIQSSTPENCHGWRFKIPNEDMQDRYERNSYVSVRFRDGGNLHCMPANQFDEAAMYRSADPKLRMFQPADVQSNYALMLAALNIVPGVDSSSKSRTELTGRNMLLIQKMPFVHHAVELHSIDVHALRGFESVAKDTDGARMIYRLTLFAPNDQKLEILVALARPDQRWINTLADSIQPPQ